MPARTVDGPGLGHQGWRQRRRLRPGGAHGGVQPPFQRRLPRGGGRPQPARGGARRVDLPRQRAEHRPAVDHLAAHHGHERPRAAQHRGGPGRQGARGSPAGRLRDRRGLRDHGGVRARERPEGSPRAARPHRGGLHLRRRPRDGRRPQGRRRDDGDHEGRHQAEPGPDPGGPARARPRRAVRQHRARQQLDHRRSRGAEARRLRRHRGGVRLRPRASRSSATSCAAPAGSLPAPPCW